MSTLIELAQAIETEYTDGTNAVVKVARPDMNSAIGASNVPYFKETGSVTGEQASGMLQGYTFVKAQINTDGDFAMLIVGIVADIDTGAYSLTAAGRKVLEDYRSFYRPFGTEFDSMWAAVITHFESVRNLRFIKRIDYWDGNPVYGHVNGLRLVGDGVTTFEAYNEFWAYEATYSAGWTIKSWKS